MNRLLPGLLILLFASSVIADLPNDPINVVEKLPSSYPDTWVYAHDTNFYALSDGSSEVWAFDTKSKKGTKRFVLKEWSVSIKVTSGESPYLIVTNGNYNLDVYSANDGKWKRTIGGRAFEMPMAIHAVK